MGSLTIGMRVLEQIADNVWFLPLVLVLSILVLVKASDWFTGAAERIGLATGLPSFIVGVTIIALGTSLPELVSSVLAVLRGASEIVPGNVVGSNIANLLVILGIAAIIDKRLRITRPIAYVDLPFLLASSFFVGLIIWDQRVSRLEAVLCLVLLLIYLHFAIAADRIAPEPEDRRSGGSIGLDIVILLTGAVLIYLGAEGTVFSVIALSDAVGIGREVIAASVVAFGTSLPEVSVTIAAGRRGNAEMAVGNVIGSNIFNAFAVIGVSAMIDTLIVPRSILEFALPMMIVATLLTYFIVMQQRMTRWEGCLLLVFYVYFICELFALV